MSYGRFPRLAIVLTAVLIAVALVLLGHQLAIAAAGAGPVAGPALPAAREQGPGADAGESRFLG